MKRNKFLWILVVLLFCILATILSASSSLSSENNEPAVKNIYINEQVGTTLTDKLQTLLNRRILPALPGSLLLLFFSLLFSSINFYGILPQKQHSLKRSWKYLLWWVIVNYIFAMIFLLLILPSGVSLTNLNKTLLLYCLVATALPELSANIKLQFGKFENQSLNLYKYKNKISDIIAKQLSKSYMNKRREDLTCLVHFYTDRLDALKNKLTGFLRQINVSTMGDTNFSACIEDVSNTSADSLISCFTEKEEIMTSLIDHFQDDIDHFKESPVFNLMCALRPQLSVQDARKLVRQGIVSPKQFIRHTLFNFQRRRVATATGIDLDQLRFVHFSTRKVLRRKRLNRLKAVFVSSAIVLAIIFLIYNQADRSYHNYDPKDLGYYAEILSDEPQAGDPYTEEKKQQSQEEDK
jgi:hypothetical protein